VDIVTHYYFDQPERAGRDRDDLQYLKEAAEVIPVALNYNPLPYIFEGRQDEMPESDVRNYVLVNRTTSNYQRFRFQAAQELSQFTVRSHAMYHDYGASKWRLDSPEAFEDFQKQANVTQLWKSESQALGKEVIGNDEADNALVGVQG